MTEIEALVLSAAIEGPVAYTLVRAARFPGRGPLHAGLAAMLATAVTHPQLWQGALWLYPRIGFWSGLLIAESLVVLAEAAIIAWAAGLSPWRALAVSGLANGASGGAGLLLAA
jgi:hypothetical protein